MNQKKLADFVDEISDDFMSTFTVVEDNKLYNMLGMPGDFDNLRGIIRKYLPKHEVTFTKTDRLGNDEEYDIYVIQANERNKP